MVRVRYPNSTCAFNYCCMYCLLVLLLIGVHTPVLTRGLYHFIHFVTCRLFFDDWRYSFEIIENMRLQNKSGYYQRVVNNGAFTMVPNVIQQP